jgi:hypothetical protein
MVPFWNVLRRRLSMPSLLRPLSLTHTRRRPIFILVSIMLYGSRTTTKDIEDLSIAPTSL